jgi:hypothetical protein
MGYAKIEIERYAGEFEYGTWNPRPLVEARVKDIVKSMEFEGVQWYKVDALLPLVVEDTMYIDRTLLTKDLTVGRLLPKLKLTGEGVKKMKWTMASGQHRVEAILERRAGLTKKAEGLRKLIDKLNPDKWTGFERMEELKVELRIIENESKLTEFWGVQVIDQGK